MRLHRLRVRGFRGLRDVTIEFPPSTLDYGETDLRFFAGRNGSGKSTALEALALIFSHLAVNAHPGFPFELDYTLDGADIRLTAEGFDSRRGLSAQRREPEQDTYHEFPLGSSNTRLLPTRVIGYSTGPTSGMGDALFKAIQRQEAEILIEEEGTDEQSDVVRLLRETFLETPGTVFLDGAGSTLPTLTALVSERRASLVTHATDAVGLDSVRPLLSFTLQVAADWDALLPAHQHEDFRRFLELATLVTSVEHFDDSGAHLVVAFDVDADGVLAERLREVVGTPLTLLETLVSWMRRSVLQRVRLVLRKHGIDDPITDDDLSDGELFYLSRYALLLLAAETSESLILLDEPETHFNDNWKVDLVDSVTQALGGGDRKDGHQVVIATHSSLTLTDAEAALIQLFVRRGDDVTVLQPPVPTFGAAPGDLGRLLFGLDAPVGRFAERTLRGALSSDDAERIRLLASATGPGYLRLALQAHLDDVDAEADDGGPADGGKAT